MYYRHTPASKFLTRLLHSPVYRKAHGIDKVLSDIQRYLSTPEYDGHILVFMLHYVGCPKGMTHLAVTALLESDSGDPGSCIQGALTNGMNLSLMMCAELGLVLFKTVPASFTTDMRGLHVHSKQVPNLDWA